MRTTFLFLGAVSIVWGMQTTPIPPSYRAISLRQYRKRIPTRGGSQVTFGEGIGVLKVARSVAAILRPGLALLPRAGNAATGRSAGHDDIHEIGETERILPARSLRSS
jgi:hypothetical protein